MVKTENDELSGEENVADQTTLSSDAEEKPAEKDSTSKSLAESSIQTRRKKSKTENQADEVIVPKPEPQEEKPEESAVPETLEVLQTWWEVPAIAQYVSLFRNHFQLPEIEIEELENGFIDDGAKEDSTWLRDLIVAFLRGILNGRGVNVENWEFHLSKLIGRKWIKEGKENPFLEVVSFKRLKLRTKVEVVYSLCLYRLDRSDVIEAMKSIDSEALRVQALGSDDLGNMYWYFYGTRLYKEEPYKAPKKDDWEEEWKKQKDQSFTKRGRGRPRKTRATKVKEEELDDAGSNNNSYMNLDGKSRWSVVCNTIEEWVDFAEKFKDSKSKNEKALFEIIQENFLPVLNEIYQEKERKFQQKLRELIPNRIVTRRETRRQKMESVQATEQNGYSNEDAHKLHLIEDRARRLELRNRRAMQDIPEDSRRLKRQRFSYRCDSNTSMDSDNKSDVEDYRRSLLNITDEENTGLQVKLERLLSEVKIDKDAWPFLHPVSERHAPGYYEIITEPMDLSTIENKLWNGQYKTVSEIEDDFSKMISNCELYNGDHSDLTMMAHIIWKKFRKGLNRIFESDSASSHTELKRSNENHVLKTRKQSNLGKKKKATRPAMQALEILAQASEIAIKNNNAAISLTKGNPRLNTLGSDPRNNLASTSYSDQDQYQASPDHNDVDDFDSNNLSSNGSQFDGNKTNDFNILSENEEDGASEDESERNEMGSDSSYSNSDSHHSRNDASNEVGENGFSNILDECGNDLISRIIREPLYAEDIQIQGLESSSKSESSSNRLQRKSPPSYGGLPQAEQFTQEGSSIEHGGNNIASNEITTIDASVLGLPSNGRFKMKSNNFSPNMPAELSSATYTSKTQNTEFLQQSQGLPVSHIVPVSNTQNQIQSSPPFVPAHLQDNNKQILNQPVQIITSAETVDHHVANAPFTNSFPSVTTAAISSQMIVSNSSQIPRQISPTYSSAFTAQSNVLHKPQATQASTAFSKLFQNPQAFQQNTGNQQQKQIPSLKINLPPSTGQIYVVPTTNAAQPGMTFQLFAQPTAEGAKPIQSQVHLQPVHAQSSQESRKFPTEQNLNKQPGSVGDLYGKKKSPTPEQTSPIQSANPRTSPQFSASATASKPIPKPRKSPTIQHVQQHMPKPNFVSTTLANSVVPSNQVIGGAHTNPTNPQAQSLSFSSNPNGLVLNNSEQAAPLYQAIGPNNVPVVLSGYNVTNNNSFRPNIVSTTQANSYVQNGPQLKKVFVQNPQQFQLQNRPTQYVILQAPSDNTGNIYGKIQNPQMQNSGNIQQGFRKVSPEMVVTGSQNFPISSAPMTTSQVFPQVMSNQVPQYVNIPSYMITNQGPVQNSVNQPMMNIQSYQVNNQRHLSMDCSGNG